MSSLSPVGWQQPTQVSGVEPTTMTSAPPATYLQGTLEGVANMLSLSPPDLRSALKQGRSMSDIAAQQGVGRQTIVQYIEQQVQQQRASQGKAPIDPATLDQVVGNAVDRHRHGHSHHRAGTAQSQQPAPTQAGEAPQASLNLLA